MIRSAVRPSPAMAALNAATPYTPPAAVSGCCCWALPLVACSAAAHSLDGLGARMHRQGDWCGSLSTERRPVPVSWLLVGGATAERCPGRAGDRPLQATPQDLRL
jgi:hypothetical protein